MRETESSDQPQLKVDVSSEFEPKTEIASGWREFFAVFLAGTCVSGNARPDPAGFETRLHWQQMVMGISSCSFGALLAACFAVNWRKLRSF